MLAQIVDRQKSFALGEVVKFSGPEIWEIGFSLRAAVTKLVFMLQEFARPLSVQVNEPREVADDEPQHKMDAGMQDARACLDYYPEND